MFVYLINEPGLNKPSLNIIMCVWISSLVCDLIKVLYKHYVFKIHSYKVEVELCKFINNFISY